jgi:hypothetical protein
MENKNFQILEIDTFQLPLVKFISKTVKDRGNPLTYYCVTPPFSINFRCQIENQVSDYRLLGASSLIYKLA